MLHIALRILAPGLPPGIRHTLLAVYAVGFAGVVLLINESFSSIVRFYVPALLLFLVGAGLHAIRSGSGWSLIAAGLVVSAGAALLQQAQVALEPYLDHNAVYHVLQSIALVFLYRGFRAVPEGGETAYAVGANSASRGGRA